MYLLQIWFSNGIPITIGNVIIMISYWWPPHENIKKDVLENEKIPDCKIVSYIYNHSFHWLCIGLHKSIYDHGVQMDFSHCAAADYRECFLKRTLTRSSFHTMHRVVADSPCPAGLHHAHLASRDMVQFNEAIHTDKIKLFYCVLQTQISIFIFIVCSVLPLSTCWGKICGFVV